MRAAIILSLLLLARAAADQAPPALRGSRSLSDVMENMTTAVAAADNAASSEDAMLEGVSEETGSSLAAAGVNDSELVAADLADLLAMAGNLSEGNVSEDGMEALLLMRGGWHQGGDKMWGSGTGVESITRGNVGYYNAGMYAARAHCGGAGCALIVNPPGPRTVQHFHIHFVHYHSYGADLKRRLESKVCGRSGWQEGGLPCGGGPTSQE